MYIPSHFEEKRIPVLHDLIESNPFGALVVQTSEGLQANHIPFLLDRQVSVHGVLRAHIARANPLWKLCQQAADALVIFKATDGYVTPSWYPSKKADGKVVPTWNYAVAHVHGRVEFIDDPQWLLSLVERLTNDHEKGSDVPWAVKDAPKDYVDKNLRAIVGVQIVIQRIDGKFKLSQNKQDVDRDGVIEGLRRARTENADSLANWMSESAT